MHETIFSSYLSLRYQWGKLIFTGRGGLCAPVYYIVLASGNYQDKLDKTYILPVYYR